MAHSRCKTLSSIELAVMRVIWRRGQSTIAEVRQSFPTRKRPDELVVKATLNRLVKRSALRCAKTEKDFLYEAVITIEAERRGIVNELLAFLNGSPKDFLNYVISSDGFKPTKDKISHKKR